jgi:hypothetical protein
MKKMALLFATFLIISCSQTTHTTLLYSGSYKLTLPNSLLAGGTIFSADELSLKTTEGQLIISSANEGLDDDFDIFQLPDFILKLKAPPIKYIDLFTSSSKEINHTYDLRNLKVLEENYRKIYHLCKNEKCLGFIVKQDAIDHIFTLHATGITKEAFFSLLKDI